MTASAVATGVESTRIALESAHRGNLLSLGVERHLARTAQLAGLRLGMELFIAPSAMRERSLPFLVQADARTAQKERGARRGTPRATSALHVATACKLDRCVPSAP